LTIIGASRSRLKELPASVFVVNKVVAPPVGPRHPSRPRAPMWPSQVAPLSSSVKRS
jgi:hypothetical protein